MKYKVKVIYVISKFDSIERFSNFIESYKKIKSGIEHELIICYKLFDKRNLDLFKNISKKISHTEFIDPYLKNDFEFMTMKRATNKLKKCLILFLNSHCYPVKKNWLKILYDSYENKSFIGISGSNHSMFTSFKIKKFYKIIYNLKNYFFYKKNFAPFPNPHIRLPSFFLKSTDFLNFMNGKRYKTKKDAWITESGYQSMTNFFLKKNFNLFIVNSKKHKFNLSEMKRSETFSYKKQNKNLISDRHMDKYFFSSKIDKKNIEKLTWGTARF